MNNFYDEARSFFSVFYSRALKGNESLEKACLMGMVEIRGARILSGLNNVTTFSVAEKGFSVLFGFTKAEIKKYEREGELQDLLEHYNGYTIGNHELINPWSFVTWLWDNIRNAEFVLDEETKELTKLKWFKNYWVDSVNFESIFEYLSDTNKYFSVSASFPNDKNFTLEIEPLRILANYSKTDWSLSEAMHFLFTLDISPIK